MKKILFATILSVLFLPALVAAATFYVSPSGSGTVCSSSSPCDLSRMTVAGVVKAGDIWRLQNGTYSTGVRIDCASGGVNNGDIGNEIVLTADNERQAFFNVNGGMAVNLVGCSYWRIEGLHVLQGDNASNASDMLAAYNGSNHITFRRNLLRNANRSLNTGWSAIIAYGVGTNQDFITLEENEIYGCYANCVNLKHSANSVVRRNYCNNSSNWDSGLGNPAACFTAYPGDNIIFENNICESVDACLDQEPDSDSTGNQYLGNIAYNVLRNVFADRGGTNNINSVIRNDVMLAASSGGSYHAWTLRTIRNLTVQNVTWRNISGGCSGFLDGTFLDNTNGSGSFTISNALIQDFCTGGSEGFHVGTGISSWTATRVNATGNSTDFSPALGDSHYVNSFSTSITGNGNCMIYVPDASNMRNYQAGGDIGANVLYEYENGVLQNGQGGTGIKRLWNPNGSPTFAGAVVAGVNDSNALIDIAARLNINQNNCPFPSYYLAPSSQNLIVALPLDTGSGTTATDISGQNNHGTFGAGVTWDNSGKFGRALSFSGTSAVTIPATPSLNLQGLTIMAWVYPTATAADFKAVAVKNYVYYLYASSGVGPCAAPQAVLGGYDANGPNFVCDTSALPLNTWTNISVTYDGNSFVYYRNGVVTSSITSAIGLQVSNGDLIIGGSQYGEFFQGKIDEVRIYDGPLSQAQIQSLMNQPLLPGLPLSTVKISSANPIKISPSGTFKVGN